ncbi:MAG: SDR family oxidoreductase [Bacteroidales bacterium]|nr:SDR family oxidoreductase [Bacteroidales bacterium]
MQAFSLKDKTIFITGASSGIGKQTAISASLHGALVIITGRNEQRLKETFDLLHGQGHQMIVADLTDESELDKMISELPLINGLVHSAGITNHTPVHFIKQKHIDQMFTINYQVPVLLSGKLIKKKKMAAQGSIVFLSSIATKYPYFGGAMYGSSKSAIEAYSRVLALELAPKAIRSNCLSPSFVKGPMVEQAGATISKEVLDNFEKVMPLGFGEPADVANTIIFFLSEASKWITGTNLILGGG